MSTVLRMLSTCLLLAVLVQPAEPAPPDAVAGAIARGVKALKTFQAGGKLRKQIVGCEALLNLTLLECDVPANDPAIRKAAAGLREASVELTHTYSIALVIMFLDRLGEPDDDYLIQALGVRLLAGQHPSGGWSYDCPRPTSDQGKRLLTHVQQVNASISGRDPSAKPARAAPPALPADLKEQVAALDRAAANERGVGDNSNTQFALLGLWAARRYAVPVERALLRVAAVFRKCQSSDGGWGYIVGASGKTTGSMTCAGLMSLAMGYGVAHEAALRNNKGQAAKILLEPTKDPAVRSGFIAVGTTIRWAKNAPAGKGGRPLVLSQGHYFLWSLERVAVAYGLDTIATRDWYAWGAELLLAGQAGDSTWHGEHAHAYGPVPDTCFALLFLRRANLTRDLTRTFKGLVKDPGDVVLKAGGLGGEGLLAKEVPSGIVFEEAKAELPAELDPQAAGLCRELLQAPPDQQPLVLERLRQGKGIIFTDALAAAIPRLPADLQTPAREALADRLTRMTAATLRDRLTDDDAEIRRAAAIACARKSDKSFVADLIGLLKDRDAKVAHAAYRALKSLTGQDFGPAPEATPAQRDRAVTAWKEWWQKQGG